MLLLCIRENRTDQFSAYNRENWSHVRISCVCIGSESVVSEGIYCFYC